MALLRILHVEDDADDAFFFSKAIKEAKPDWTLRREINGEGAIEYLRKVESDKDSDQGPHLVLLDLKLPGLSGFDVLSWTRAQPTFKMLPIIVLSGSPLAQDKKKASELGASDFIVKQSDYEQIAAYVIKFMSHNGQSGSNLGRDASSAST